MILVAPRFSMHHRREYPITPSQQAVNGALAIYVEGREKSDAQQMLFGLSVLRSSSEEQLHVATLALHEDLKNLFAT